MPDDTLTDLDPALLRLLASTSAAAEGTTENTTLVDLDPALLRLLASSSVLAVGTTENTTLAELSPALLRLLASTSVLVEGSPADTTLVELDPALVRLLATSTALAGESGGDTTLSDLSAALVALVTTGTALAGELDGEDTELVELDPAVLALLATGGAVAGDLLAGPSIAFTATATARLSPGVALEEGATSVAQAPTVVLHTSAQLELLPPLAQTSDGGPVQARAMPQVSLVLPDPAIIAGRPSLPAWWARCASSTTAVLGPAHIHAITDPDPHWNPTTGGWAYPPPAGGVGDARWSVRDLPDPAGYPGAFYWLGEPSSHDGTTHIAPACRQWAPHAGTPGAPSWRSIYPYKPSVRAHVHYGAGGQILTVTAGVRFNLHFVEHMWCDFAATMAQPFTWALAALVMDYPAPGYRHAILDAGRDPRAVGVPYYGETQVQVERRINDALAYRSVLAADAGGLHLATRGGATVRARMPLTPRARMLFGVFNGARSLVGNYSPAGKYRTAGTVATGGAHRYYTLGRAQNWLGPNHASHLVVFEIRFWHRALSSAELDAQYGQLSSTWRFSQYH